MLQVVRFMLWLHFNADNVFNNLYQNYDQT